MKKTLILILLTLFFSSCSVNQDQENSENTNSWTNIEKENSETSAIDEAELRKQKIQELRKKIALKWLIVKWDISLANWEYTSALVKYLQIHKEIPNDESIIEKLWDTYYNLKKFSQAYSYYSKISNYDKLDKNKAAKALFASIELNEENIKEISSELDLLWLDKEMLLYYKNSLVCLEDFSQCKQNYQDYFKIEEEKEKELAKTQTWELIIDKFEDLYNIKKALENYKNFQIDDLSYKWALVSAAFFENWLYPIAIETSKKVLEDRKDYKPLLKLIAKSYYELWDYVNAKVYLINYNKLVDDDSEASYFLWIIYEKLHEYILSTIHFNKALKLWYEEKLELNKRILFNYYELWEIDKMLDIFKTLIWEYFDELNENDLNLAIYYHIINDELEQAKEFAKKALEKYNESEIFNWYIWWILMEEINMKNQEIEDSSIFDEAQSYIDKWLELNSTSAMLNLVKWKLEASKWDLSKAFIYFKKTLSLDKNWDFWKIASQELENIKINK